MNNLTKMPSSFKMTVTENLENKIRILCSEFPSKEWSGVLFYIYTGSIAENNLHIICEDLFLMDIGSSGATEFKETPEIISYQIENNLLHSYTGLIHSHNMMSTFFSGIDLNTLAAEGNNMNNFVSLIVNNAGIYTAAVTSKVNHHIIGKDFTEMKFFGEDNPDIKCTDIEEKYSSICYYPLEITVEQSQHSNLLNRIQAIKPVEKKVEVPKAPVKESTKVKEPTLFEDDAFYTFDYNMKVDNDVVLDAAVQITTGCILATSKEVSLEKWIPKMKERFDARFIAIDDYAYWMEGLIDTVLATAYLYNVPDLDVQCAVVASKVIKLLEKHSNDNVYIRTIIANLERFII